MSKKNLVVNIAGLNLYLETDTEEGFVILNEWLKDYKSNGDADFSIHFYKDKKIFDFVLEENGYGKEKNMKMQVMMGNVDLRKKFAFGPDASYINRELAKYLYSNFLRLVMQYVLPEYHGVLIHASAVMNEGEGYVFIGPNEGGKSTLAKKTGKLILSDDCIGLKYLNEKWYSCSTPWGDISSYGNFPMKGIYFINKSNALKIKKTEKIDAVKTLFSSVCVSFPKYPTENTEMIEHILSSVEQICCRVPIYNLEFRKNDNVFDEIFKDWQP